MDSIVDSSRTVYSDGGIARVALSNLPPWLQQRYNYDPDKAAQFVAEQRRKEQERRDQYGRQSALIQQQAAGAAAQNAANTERVRVYEILGNLMGATKCRTDKGEILICNLPNKTKAYSDQAAEIEKLKTQIENGENEIADEAGRPRRAPDVNYLQSVGLMGGGIAPRHVTTHADVADIKRRLDKLETEHLASSVVLAFRMGRKYAGLDIWNCVGIAPAQPQKRPSK